jgi:hypothetical protein
MTMPSARPVPRPRLWTRIARETAGVGTACPSGATRISTPRAASTSIAVTSAGSESACVSLARNSGPSMPSASRCRQIASVIARMCVSLKVVADELPRCPEVPKETRWRGFSGSGIRA